MDGEKYIKVVRLLYTITYIPNVMSYYRNFLTISFV